MQGNQSHFIECRGDIVIGVGTQFVIKPFADPPLQVHVIYAVELI